MLVLKLLSVSVSRSVPSRSLSMFISYRSVHRDREGLFVFLSACSVVLVFVPVLVLSSCCLICVVVSINSLPRRAQVMWFTKLIPW